MLNVEKRQKKIRCISSRKWPRKENLIIKSKNGKEKFIEGVRIGRFIVTTTETTHA